MDYLRKIIHSSSRDSRAGEGNPKSFSRGRPDEKLIHLASVRDDETDVGRGADFFGATGEVAIRSLN
jgi:hypothetical protein